jgi:hypothetical protein
VWVEVDAPEHFWRRHGGRWQVLAPSGNWIAAQPSHTLRKIEDPVEESSHPPVAVVPDLHGSETLVELPPNTFIELEGDSAYEVAVKNGFIGTEQEWLATLGGTDGSDGKEGPQGPQGIQGQQGIQGTQGVVGVEGIQGIEGPVGQPGVSLDIEGHVLTYADLPDNPVAGQAWIVDADGLLYYFDAVTGFPAAGQGVPFQGPQGIQGIQGVPGGQGGQGIQGVQGTQGASLLSGDGLPAISLGNQGDYYLDETTNLLYGPKNPTAIGPAISAISSISADYDNTGHYAVGDTWQVNSNGFITDLRFWRCVRSTYTTRHLRLYRGTTLLDQVSTTAGMETGSGWRTVPLTTSVNVSAGQSYVVVFDGDAYSNISYEPISTVPQLTHVGYVVGNEGEAPFAGAAGASYLTDVVYREALAVWPVATSLGTPFEIVTQAAYDAMPTPRPANKLFIVL